MPAENANTTVNGNDARAGIGPGGIGGIDTEAADLDLLNRLVRENNQDDTDDTDTGDDGEGEDGGSGSDAGNEKSGEKKGAKDTKKGVEDGGEGEGSEEGDDSEDGDTDSDSDQALIDFAKEIGYDDLDSLSEAELAVVRKAFDKHGKAMAAGGDDDEEFEDALTEFEKEEGKGEDGDGKNKKGKEEDDDGDGEDGDGERRNDTRGQDANDPRQVFSSILDGKFKPVYKSDSDYYGKLKKAGEEGDLEQYTVLQNQRFIEQFMRFAKPIMDVFVERQLGTFADIITPALSTVSRISSNERLSTARNQAVSALESAANSKGTKPYAGIKKFLSPDKPDENVVINGRSYPSSPYARTLKKHPEILSIRVEGKDGQPDYTKTFIAQYKHAMRLERQGRASGQSPVPKKSATELVKAGVAAGQRQAKKEAGGKLNSNSSSGGGSGKAGNRDKSWAEKYGTLGQGDGNASWIGS